MTNYEKLIDTLREAFMLDKAELDFGIYRIMNQKRKDIEQFLEKDLIPQVREILQSNSAVDVAQLEREIQQEIDTAKKYGNPNPEQLPVVQELREKYEQANNMTDLENEVFSLLSNFFKRYFDKGDFISMRRYKKDVYAIPYEGEEVKLHWANADQYYIKSSENFKIYRFKLSNGKSVTFELLEATTEQNNNKSQGDKERKFAIVAENPCEVVDEELKIYFNYEPMDKKVKQDDLLKEAFLVVKDQIPVDFAELLSLRTIDKDKQRTLLQKNLTDYTAKNTFDFFIHKDLNGFLTRELDFYIKNEVLFIDDINTLDEKAFLMQLSKIKATKKIGEKIITFLAHIEDFQKKLWLKKKMVIECNYCITLDRVPEILYAEIAQNQAQINEWITLFAIDEIKASASADMFSEKKVGFSNPLTIEFLKQNPFLALDTAFFSSDFKWKLISEIDNFDDKCDGILINSENFQALKAIENRIKNNVDGIYVDPPYNTSASEIIYKNSFKDSSWLSLIDNRVELVPRILKENGLFCLTIDDFEKDKVKLLLDSIFSKEKELGVIPIRINPSGRSTTQGISIAHEYAIFYGNNVDSKVGRLERNNKQTARYDEKDDEGAFEWVNFRKHGGTRMESPSMFYPFFVSESAYRVPVIEWDDLNREYRLLEEPSSSERIVYPIDENGIERRWKWGLDRVLKSPSEFCVRKDRTGLPNIYVKARMNEDGVLPLTWWDKKEYSATAYGTNYIKDMFNRVDIFSYPKSIYAVEDCIKVLNIPDNGIILDFFVGSGTTIHATINLNREFGYRRKWIGVEMGNYFVNATKPRVLKAIYSKDWRNGKPISRQGISHCFKYFNLESYEDTLNNLAIKKVEVQQLAFDRNPKFKEGYMLNYMLDVETKDSLLNLEWFVDPFNCYLNITKNNEMKPTKVDLVETFNYLIGLVVENYAVPKPGYVVITGKNLSGEKILVVWRDCNQHDNQSLNDFLSKSKYNPLDAEFDRIYVNGDNNVENLKVGDERWKVVLIEEEFHKRMFEN